MTKNNFSQKLVSILIIIAMMIPVMLVPAQPAYGATDKLKLTAKSAILIDAESGEVLYERAADRKLRPASMTKMMTAILTIENLNLKDKVKISRHVTTIGGNAIGLKYNERISVDELLHAMLIYSANDAAVALGEAISGSEEEFAKLMTKKAKSLGCTGTTFKNPNGLDADGHVSTARDMAKIARKAMEYQQIRDIVCLSQYELKKTNKRPATLIGSTDRLLFDTYSYVKVNGKERHPYYKNAIGIKTGYTDLAGGCLASMAVKGDESLISVVMKSTDMQRFGDAITLLEYGFKNYSHYTVFKKGDVVDEARIKGGNPGKVEVIATEDLSVVLSKKQSKDDVKTEVIWNDENVAPMNAGTVVGTVFAYRGEKKVSSVKLVTTADVEKSTLAKILEHKVLIIIFIALILLVIIIALVISAEKKKRARKRRRRQ